MKYMVMECHLSYAVVLDEDGRFLKVANRHYEVGQTVTEVIEMQVPQAVPQKKKATRWMFSMAAMAACLVLVIASVFHLGQMPYASVYMTINPEIRIDVSRSDVVVGLDGINSDGENLIKGYSYKKKDLDLVMNELIDKAIDMGYLHEGGQISLMLDADNHEWVATHSAALTDHLNEYLNEKLSVTIEVTDRNTQNDQVVIPVTSGESSYGESDYGKDTSSTQPPVSSEPSDSEYSNNDYDDGQTDYGEQAGPGDGQSEYIIDDSQTDYTDQANNDDENQSNYGGSDDSDDPLTDDDSGSSDDSQGDDDSGSSDDSQSNYGTDDSDDSQADDDSDVSDD